MVSQARYERWQGIADTFQTAAINAQEDYKLKNLVEVFKLSGDLIGAKILSNYQIFIGQVVVMTKRITTLSP